MTKWWLSEIQGTFSQFPLFFGREAYSLGVYTSGSLLFANPSKNRKWVRFETYFIPKLKASPLLKLIQFHDVRVWVRESKEWQGVGGSRGG